MDERKQNLSEAIVHHLHHRDQNDGYKREVSINGSIYSVCLSSDDPEENIEFLTKKSMEILKELLQEAK